MSYLLDVNVLIALIDSRHVSHGSAHEWFDREGKRCWATCPITESGLVRIVSRPSYPNRLGRPGEAVDLIRQLREVGRHTFWPDEISLLDPTFVDADRLGGPASVTDTYLLALAASRGGKLATLDRRLATAAVRNGASALVQIG